MPRSEKFNKELDLRLDQYLKEYKAKNPDKAVTRQTKASKRGKLVETLGEELLLAHPFVNKIQREVYDPRIDEFSNIDRVLELTNGTTLYLPCARDLWRGTSQQDRLQLVYYKQKLWDNNPKSFPPNSYFCYLCADDYKDYLLRQPKRKSRRQPRLQQVVKFLEKRSIIHNLDTLWDFITKVGA